MKKLRWRLRTLMGLIVLAALGVWVGRLVLPRHDFVRDRLRTFDQFKVPPRTPAVESALVAALGDWEPEVRRYALWSLTSMGSTAPEMVPALVRHLETETLQSRGRDRRSPNQVDPAQALKRLQLPAATIAPQLRTAMASPDRLIRSRALDVLADAAGRPGSPPDPALVALLLAGLADTNPKNRLTAAEGLARLDAVARRRGVAILVEQLRGPDRPMALVAAINLARFDPEGRAGAAVLADRLDAGDRATRLEDLYLLGRLGPQAQPAVPAIVRAMTRPEAREYVDRALHGLDPGQADGTSWINIGVSPGEDRDAPLPWQGGPMAALALGRIGLDADREAVALLIDLVRGDDEARRLAAARALGDLGPRASAAFPDLLALVDRTTAQPAERRGDWIMAAQLTRTLRQVVAEDDPRLVAALVRLLTTGSPWKRFEAAIVLHELNPPAPGAIPALAGALKDGSQSVRSDAAISLGRYAGPGREAAVPPLLGALHDPDRHVRFQAAKSLTALHAGAPEVVPVAVALLGDGNLAYRRGAIEILGACGPEARPALPTLLGMRSDPDVFVRESVAKAVESIGTPDRVGDPAP